MLDDNNNPKIITWSWDDIYNRNSHFPFQRTRTLVDSAVDVGGGLLFLENPFYVHYTFSLACGWPVLFLKCCWLISFCLVVAWNVIITIHLSPAIVCNYNGASRDISIRLPVFRQRVYMILIQVKKSHRYCNTYFRQFLHVT